MMRDLLLWMSVAAVGLLLLPSGTWAWTFPVDINTVMGENPLSKRPEKEIFLDPAGDWQIGNRTRARPQTSLRTEARNWAERLFHRDPYLANPSVHVQFNSDAVSLQGSVDTQLENVPRPQPWTLVKGILQVLKRLTAGCPASRRSDAVKRERSTHWRSLKIEGTRAKGWPRS